MNDERVLSSNIAVVRPNAGRPHLDEIRGVGRIREPSKFGVRTLTDADVDDAVISTVHAALTALQERGQIFAFEPEPGVKVQRELVITSDREIAAWVFLIAITGRELFAPVSWFRAFKVADSTWYAFMMPVVRPVSTQPDRSILIQAEDAFSNDTKIAEMLANARADLQTGPATLRDLRRLNDLNSAFALFRQTTGLMSNYSFEQSHLIEFGLPGFYPTLALDHVRARQALSAHQVDDLLSLAPFGTGDKSERLYKSLIPRWNIEAASR